MPKLDDANLNDIPALTGLLAELFSIEKDFQADAAMSQKQRRNSRAIAGRF